jgi:hypothetical protein
MSLALFATSSNQHKPHTSSLVRANSDSVGTPARKKPSEVIAASQFKTLPLSLVSALETQVSREEQRLKAQGIRFDYEQYEKLVHSVLENLLSGSPPRPLHSRALVTEPLVGGIPELNRLVLSRQVQKYELIQRKLKKKAKKEKERQKVKVKPPQYSYGVFGSLIQGFWFLKNRPWILYGSLTLAGIYAAPRVMHSVQTFVSAVLPDSLLGFQIKNSTSSSGFTSSRSDSARSSQRNTAASTNDVDFESLSLPAKLASIGGALSHKVANGIYSLVQ